MKRPRSLTKLKKKATSDSIKNSSFRSGLEEKVALKLDELGVTFSFEPGWIEYVKPSKVHKYLPDFIVGDVIIECKGRFDSADRAKHLLIRKHYGRPSEGGIDIRFLFSNPRQRISKKSKTTYAMWCDRHGFRYADFGGLEELLNDE